MQVKLATRVFLSVTKNFIYSYSKKVTSNGVICYFFVTSNQCKLSIYPFKMIDRLFKIATFADECKWPMSVSQLSNVQLAHHWLAHNPFKLSIFGLCCCWYGDIRGSATCRILVSMCVDNLSVTMIVLSNFSLYQSRRGGGARCCWYGATRD